MADKLYRRLSCVGCSTVFESLVNPRGGVRKKCDGCLPNLDSRPRCVVSGCANPAKCKAMCENHYALSTYRSTAKPLAKKQCARCGCDFSTSQPLAEFCSRKCKLYAWRTANPERCAALKKAQKERSALKPGAFCAYFSRACESCGKWWGSRRDWSECRDCKSDAAKPRNNADHRTRSETKHRAAAKVVRCDECRADFCPLYGHKYGAVALCSPCSESRKKAWKKANTHIKRAKRVGVPYRYLRPTSILARDKWTCQLCGEPTPKSLRGTCDPRAPELDHILPIAAGGAHVPENCQCACRECNGAKGANPLWRPTKRVDAMETI